MLTLMHRAVAVIGAGPAGIMLTKMLLNRGIDIILIENRNEKYLRRLNRGGYLNQANYDLLLHEADSEYWSEKAIAIKKKIIVTDGQKDIVPIHDHSDESAWILDQTNICNQLLDELKNDKCPILWEAKAQRYLGLDQDKVKIIYTQNGQLHDMTCDYVVGCDGYRGISRRSIPQAVRNETKEELPLAWLEWRSEIEYPISNPILAIHNTGFAMMIRDSQGGSRYYLEIERGLEVNDLPNEQSLWESLEKRLDTSLDKGVMQNKIIDYMRCFYTDMMQYGRLFIAGDAAHQVPRLGSEGINMALADAARLAKAFELFYEKQDSSQLENYTKDSLRENLPVINRINVLNKRYHQV